MGLNLRPTNSKDIDSDNSIDCHPILGQSTSLCERTGRVEEQLFNEEYSLVYNRVSYATGM